MATDRGRERHEDGVSLLRRLPHVTHEEEQQNLRQAVRNQSFEIRNWLIGELSDLQVSQTLGRNHQDAIRKQIHTELGRLLKSEQITEVLFSEFNVQ